MKNEITKEGKKSYKTLLHLIVSFQINTILRSELTNRTAIYPPLKERQSNTLKNISSKEILKSSIVTAKVLKRKLIILQNSKTR